VDGGGTPEVGIAINLVLATKHPGIPCRSLNCTPPTGVVPEYLWYMATYQELALLFTTNTGSTIRLYIRYPLAYRCGPLQTRDILHHRSEPPPCRGRGTTPALCTRSGFESAPKFSLPRPRLRLRCIEAGPRDSPDGNSVQMDGSGRRMWGGR